MLTNTYPQFDQTSTPKCRVEVWSKFGRNFDRTSTPGVSKFGVEVWSTFDRHLDFTMCSINISSTPRPNFDTGGVEIRSKFLSTLYQTSTLVSKFGRSFYQTSTPTNMHNFDKHICTILTHEYS